MDERFKKLMDKLESMKIDLDETFSFHCTMCGKCCINMEDLLLSPRDLYNMSRELKITPGEFFNKYCKVFIGTDSRFPIIRLKSQGTDKHCPMLKDMRCMVHKSKPAICSMFPIGRFLVSNDEEKDGSKDKEKNQIQYVFNNLGCGDKSETHIVKEYLEECGIPVHDSFFVKWKQTILDIGGILRKMEEVFSDDTMVQFRKVALVEIYLNYETEIEFESQFKENVMNHMKFLLETPLIPEI